MAADTRARLIELGRSVDRGNCVPPVPSKLELIDTAHAAGYTVVLDVVADPQRVGRASRASHRVNAGGHDVPEHKIRERYQRLWALVAAAIIRSGIGRPV